MKRVLYGLLLCCYGFAPGNCSSSEMLAQYGYTEMRPPNSFLRPGTLVLVHSKNPFQASIICGAEASLGPDLETMHSVTSSGSVRQFNNRSFKVDASALQFAESENLRDVQSVTAKIRNARIVELTDEAVIEGMQHRSPQCAQAVQHRVDQGYTITMISSALYADFDYQVEFSHHHGHRANAPLKALAISDLAVALEGDTEMGNSGSIYAQGLILGVRDSEYLSALAIPSVDEGQFARHTRHIPLLETAKVKDGKVKLIDGPKTEVVPLTQPIALQDP
jgi:hypothetical protein